MKAEGRRREAGAVGDGAAELGEWVIALRRPVGEEFGRGEAHGSAEQELWERNGTARRAECSGHGVWIWVAASSWRRGHTGVDEGEGDFAAGAP